MMRNPFLLVALLIWLSGDAAAQYQRTPAGENIDVRVLSRTPDDLKGKAIIDSSGQVVGRFDDGHVARPVQDSCRRHDLVEENGDMRRGHLRLPFAASAWKRRHEALARSSCGPIA